MDSLLTEVARRQNILEQLAAIVGAGTTVVRGPRLISRSIQVSAFQWALLVRVADGSTARVLAWDLGRPSAARFPYHSFPRSYSEWRCAVSRSAEDRVRAELRLIRDNVGGVQGSLVATNDGFLVAHDIPDIEPTAVAALAATTRSLASRTTQSTGCGQFREAVSRGSHGYLVVYAAGRSTLLAVVGSTELNIGMLHYQTREITERIATYAAEFGTRPAMAPAAPAAVSGGPGHGGMPACRPAPLPVRRNAAG